MSESRSESRERKIVEILVDEHGMSVKQLAECFKVTEMTIRRDLKNLEDRGDIKMIHGAAILNRTIQRENEIGGLEENLASCMAEKERIGEEAAKMIKRGSTVFFDIGTTTAKVASHIEEKSEITAFCFSRNVFIELDKIKPWRLILGGGMYHRDTQCFESEEAIELISSVSADIAFVVPTAVDKEMGLMCDQEYEKKLKSALIKHAKKVVLLSDSSKFRKISRCNFGSISDVDVVISDSGLSQEWKNYFLDKGIEFYLV